MKQISILLITILLIGCTKTEYIKETIYINNTIEIIKEIEIPYNLTCPECPVYNGSTDRELELIRRLKFFENQQSKYFNDTECQDSLNRTEKELEDCKEELCEHNVSSC